MTKIIAEFNRLKKDFHSIMTVVVCILIASLITTAYLFWDNIKIEEKARKAELENLAGIHSVQDAKKQSREAIIQKRISDQQQEIAKQLKEIADRALTAAQDAQNNAENAKKQTQKTLDNLQVAYKRLDSAKEDLKKTYKSLAKSDSDLKKDKVRIENSEMATKRLEVLSKARDIALQSVKLKSSGAGNDTTAPLLALQAYRFYKEENAGPENDSDIYDPDIFNALSAIVNDTPELADFRDAVRGLSISGDGKLLAACSDDHTIKLWKKEGGRFRIQNKVNTSAFYEGMRCVCLSDDGSLLMAGTAQGKILFWDSGKTNKAPEIICNLDPRFVINKIISIPGKNLFISASSDGYLRTWKRQSTHQKHNNKNITFVADTFNEKSNIKCLAYYKNRIVTGNANGDVIRFNAASPLSPAGSFQAHSGAILSVAIGERLIATGNTFGTIKLWDANNYSFLCEIPGNGSGINSFCFYSAAGNLMLAAAGYDRSIRIWPLKKLVDANKNLDVFPIVISNNAQWVMDILYSPAEKALISAGADQKVRVFNIDQDNMGAEICKKVKRNFLTRNEWNDYIGTDIPYEETCKTKPGHR